MLNPIVLPRFAGKVDTAMLESATPSSARPWQVVAAEASCEQDPAKLLRLVKELTHALDQERMSKLQKEAQELEAHSRVSFS